MIYVPKTRAELARYIDSTLLRPNAKLKEIVNFCNEAREYNCFGAVVNPCYVDIARNVLRGTNTRAITVIGYPLGANAKETKESEAKTALANAQEIDTVMNIGKFKSKDYGYVTDEIQRIVRIAYPNPVKVIIECCYLTDREIAKASRLAKDAGARFVKTSTGMGSSDTKPSGATVKDVRAIYKAVGPGTYVKASGGIKTTEQALEMIRAGASRIGTSAAAEILKGMKE